MVTCNKSVSLLLLLLLPKKSGEDSYGWIDVPATNPACDPRAKAHT